MSGKTVWEVADEYRRAQEAHDAAVANDLARNMYDVQTKLQKQYTPIMEAITKAVERGEPLTPSQVAQMARFATLDRQATLLLAKFGQYADDTITPQIRRAIDDAQAAAKDMTTTAFIDTEPVKGAGAAVMTGWNQLDDRTIEALSARTSANSPLNQLAGLNAQTIDNMKAILLTGAALGHNQTKMAKAMQAELGVPLARAMTIARTEVHTAAREATRLTYEANSDIVGGWIWRCSRTARTCAVCWAMDGQEFDTSVKHYTHVNCRCTMVPKTHSWAELGFKGVKEAEQPPSGADAFGHLSAADQKRVLGPGKYQLYSTGKLKLAHLVGEATDPRYGGYRYERSLKDLSQPQRKVLPVDPPHKPVPPIVPPKPPPGKRGKISPADFVFNPDAPTYNEWTRYVRETGDRPTFAQFMNKFGVDNPHGGTSTPTPAPPPKPAKPKAAPKVVAPTPAPPPKKQAASGRNEALEQEAEDARQRVIQAAKDNPLLSDTYSYSDRQRFRQQRAAAMRREVGVSNPAQFFIEYSRGLAHTDSRYSDGVAIFKDFVSADALGTVKVRIRDAQTESPISGHNRGHMYEGDVYMSTAGGAETVIHELGHVLEHHNFVARQASLTFLQRRTDGERARPLGGGYRTDEISRPDNFINPYIGKDYQDYATEVMSMGLEQFYADASLLARKDPDMFRHVYINARDPSAALAYQQHLLDEHKKAKK
jgi:SPP1 gp7 family putative phage head morphogenesis protein